jgi:hypothetical protein
MDEVLVVKVKMRGTKGDIVYRNEVSLSNPSLLLLVLKDLESGFNAPIKKACRRFLEIEEDKIFPF